MHCMKLNNNVMPIEMKRIPTTALALLIGCLIEGLWILLFLIFFEAGGDGIAPGISIVIFWAHSPGLVVQRLLHTDTGGGWLPLSTLLVPQVVVFAAIVFPAIQWFKKRMHTEKASPRPRPNR